MRRQLALLAGAATVGAVLGFPGMAVATSTSTLSPQDRAFITQNGQTDLAEISLGKVAQQRGATAATRQIAATIVADHKQVLAHLRQVASSVGVTLPTAPNAIQLKMAQMVKAESGVGFDKAYASGQISGHQVSVVQTQAEIAKGSNPAVIAFAKYYLPIAEKHLSLSNQDFTALTTGVSAVPVGAPQTGGGSTAGIEDAWLFGVGAAALAGAAGIGVFGRRRLALTGGSSRERRSAR